MKKRTIFMISVFLYIWYVFSGCSKESTPDRKMTMDELKQGKDSPPINLWIRGTIDIEECQYFVVYIYGGNYNIVHKGNCSNPIHRQEFVTSHSLALYRGVDDHLIDSPLNLHYYAK